MGLLANRRRVLLPVALGAALLAGAVVPARAGEPVVLGCASAANLKGLFAKLTQLAEKFVPGTGAQVQGMSAMLTQAPEWAGADWSKPATIVLFGGKAFGKTEPVPVALVPLADAAQFRQAPRPEGGPANFEIRDNIAILAEEKAALAAITPQRLGLYSKFPKIAAAADLYLTIYVAQAVAEYQAEIDEGVKGMEQQFGQMPMAGPFAMFGKVVKCIGPLLNLAGKQIRRASLTVQFNDDSVELWGRLYATDDTELGTFLSGQPAETTDLVKYLPADAVFSMAGKLDMEKARPMVDTLVKTLATPLELSVEDQQKIRDLIFASTQTGEFAAAMAGGAAHPGMQSIQVFRIADAAKYRAAGKDSIEWLMKSGFGGFMEAAGVKMNVDYKPGARDYQGIPIDRLTVTMAAAPDAPPNPMMGQQPPQVTELAAVDTLAAAASNNPGGDLLNGVLDRIKGGGTPGFDTTPACKAARAAAPKGANIITHMAFNSAMAKFVEEAAKQQPALAMMAAAIIKADPTEEPITSYAAFGTNVVEFRTRVPHQPILSLVTRVRVMIEQQQKALGPKPKEEDDF